MKFNMAYRRFRHFGKDKVTMDFAFFAIAFNLVFLQLLAVAVVALACAPPLLTLQLR